MSRKRPRQQRRQGVTEKASAAAEARCHRKGFGRNRGAKSDRVLLTSENGNGGEVSRKRPLQGRRQVEARLCLAIQSALLEPRRLRMRDDDEIDRRDNDER